MTELTESEMFNHVLEGRVESLTGECARLEAVVRGEPVRVYVGRLHPNARLPQFAHPTDAGADLHICEEITIHPGEFARINMGFCMNLPPGHAGHISGRSGLACAGILVHPGLIDPDYRAAVHVIMFHHGREPVTFHVGDRVAQLEVRPFPAVDYVESIVHPSDRGGLGSTGMGPLGEAQDGE